MADNPIFPGILPDEEDREAFEPVTEIETGAADEQLTIAEVLDAGECPWCDEYDGDHVEQHAPKAHPDEWSAYRVREA